MIETLLSFLLTSTLHANSIDAADFAYKTAWDRKPILSVEPVPERIGDLEMAELTAESVIVIDLTSGKVLYEKNSEAERPIASLTKLMTGLIIAEEETPYTVVKVPAEAVNAEGSTIWLNADEEMTVKDLLYGMMISSGNDAALTLASYNAGSVENFVRKMNQKAEKLGLQSTHFANPVGFDQQANHSTARDIALLSLYALQNEFLMEPVEFSEYETESVSGIPHEFLTTNKLLEGNLTVAGWSIGGLKTGTTPEAGECLVTIATNDEGDQVLTVLLGSQNRFPEALSILEWLNVSYSW